MFNIFKKQETLPLIVNMMAEYLSQEEEKTKSSLIPMEDIKNKYDKLVALGLQNSTNAKELYSIIENQNIYNENIEKAKKLIEYIKKVNQLLERNSYLISLEQFEVVCKRYNLIYQPIENYTGVIPEENIIQLEKISKKLSELDDINKDLYAIKEISVNKKDDKAFINWIKNKGFLYLPSSHGFKRYNGFTGMYYTDIRKVESSDIVKDYPDCPRMNGSFSHISLAPLSNTSFLIAAPANNFKPTFKIKSVPKDPIVFQICPYGILIHSVWGEEADDEVLKRYKQTLNI